MFAAISVYCIIFLLLLIELAIEPRALFEVLLRISKVKFCLYFLIFIYIFS